MRNYTRYLYINLALVFFLPFFTGIVDSMCWFATNEICSSILWNDHRYMIATASTFIGVCFMVAAADLKAYRD